MIRRVLSAVFVLTLLMSALAITVPPILLLVVEVIGDITGLYKLSDVVSNDPPPQMSLE